MRVGFARRAQGTDACRLRAKGIEGGASRVGRCGNGRICRHVPCSSGGMAKITRLQALAAWQLAMDLADLVEAVVSRGPATANQTFVDQILRSSSKAAAQIAEGFLRYRPADSANYYRIARASI